MTQKYVRVKKDRDSYKAKIMSAKEDLERFDEIIRSKVAKAVHNKTNEIEKLRKLCSL